MIIKNSRPDQESNSVPPSLETTKSSIFQFSIINNHQFIIISMIIKIPDQTGNRTQDLLVYSQHGNYYTDEPPIILLSFVTKKMKPSTLPKYLS